MSLVSLTCPACGASTYVSLPTGYRFVTTEPAVDDPDRTGREQKETVCDACTVTIPVVYAPTRRG